MVGDGRMTVMGLDPALSDVTTQRLETCGHDQLYPLGGGKEEGGK